MYQFSMQYEFCNGKIVLITSFFNIITNLLLNSDYGIDCGYSPPGLVIFVVLERTFCMFFKNPVTYT